MRRPFIERTHEAAPHYKTWFFRVKCGNGTCYTNTRLPYRSKLIAIIADMVLNASMYVPLTKLLDISNYRVVSVEVWIHIVISIRSYAYRINTVWFVLVQFISCRL